MSAADRERVAFLGLGIMGAPMAANLAGAGFELIAWNRTAERATSFAAEHGVLAAATPAEAVSGAGVAITMVPDVPEVEAVLFGPGGAASTLTPGSLVVDMSTIAPTHSVRIAERLRAGNVGFLDAPVTGSRPRAQDGTLTIMAGGSPADFERARPLFEALGELIVHVGPQGHGSMAKLINNTLAATNALALAEGLVLAQAAGLDTEALRRVVGAGSGRSTMLDLKADPMISHDFEPLFKLEHMLKDVRHCLAEAEALGSPMQLARLACESYGKAAAAGLGEADFAAVVTVVEARAHKKKT